MAKLKVKVKDVINAFNGVQQIYDTVTFDRVLELSDKYDELENIVKKFEELRAKNVPNDFNDNNEVMKIELKLTTALNVEVVLDDPIQFTIDEIRESGIKGSMYNKIKHYFITSPTK